MTLCPVCREVRFKIGIPVYDGASMRVCGGKCRTKARKLAKQALRDEQAELGAIERELRLGRSPQ